MDTSFISKVRDLMALHEAMKTADFTTFLDLLQKATPPPPPPPPPTNSIHNSIWGLNSSSSAPNPGISLLKMIKAPSPPESVYGEEEWEAVPVPPINTKRNKDPEIHFIMCFLKITRMSSLMVFLKHHYLQYPDCFQITKDGHYSVGESRPHITVQFLHPGGIPNMKPGESYGEKYREWSSTLHVYYDTMPNGKRHFTEITCSMDGVVQTVAVCPPPE
jgi:hypothetical protein